MVACEPLYSCGHASTNPSLCPGCWAEINKVTVIPTAALVPDEEVEGYYPPLL